MRCQFPQGLVEIGLRRRRHAIGVLAKEDLVHVKLEDVFLAQRLLDPRGKDDFLDLALDAPVAGQQEVLHHLLGDGGRAAYVLSARPHRLDHCRGDPARVVAAMAIEILVLGRDERLFHQIGNILGR